MKKRRSCVIALAQIKYFGNEGKHNLSKIREYILKAKKKKADIVCFPEGCIHKSEILHFNHNLIKDIQEECKKNSIWGIINDDVRIKNKIYSVAILINRNGEIHGHYKKINLSGDLNSSPGKKTIVFDTDFAKIGVVLCWDLAFPKLFTEMKKKGAEIVFCPAQWRYEYLAHGAKKYEEMYRKKEGELLKTILKTRAFENLYFIALCNPVIPSKDLVSYSAIVSPHRILNEITNKEGLITARINLNEIGKLHQLYAD